MSTPDGSARIETLVTLCQRRGFAFPAGEIYGGGRASWDHGPLGVELAGNIRRQWWRSVVTGRDDVVGLDSAVVLPRPVWSAAGHAEACTAPLVECTHCHRRHRADRLAEGAVAAPETAEGGYDLTAVPCPHCGARGQYTPLREVSTLLTAQLDPLDADEGRHPLRPEIAQGVFVNFANVLAAARKRPPFGVGQIGTGFRNEITPGDFLFRTREFEQMALEFFVEPGSDEPWHEYWVDERTRWYTDLGLAAGNLRHREQPKEELAHYAKRAVDIEYRFAFSAGREWGALEAVADRTDVDLTAHTNHSGVDLSYYDQATGSRYRPYVIEPAAGVGRAMMAFLLDALTEDEAPNAKGGVDRRTVLRLDPRLAPVKAAVLPLSRNADLSPLARDVAATLRRHWNVEFDDAGAIGRRYRRQDEIGTPFCVTVDFESLADRAATVRHRDAMTQERVSFDHLEPYLGARLLGC